MISFVTAVQLPQVEWTLATPHAQFSNRIVHSTVVFDDSIWVIGGKKDQSSYFGDVWRSDDGVTWKQVTPLAAFGPRAGHGSVVFDDRMWVIAGRDGGSQDFKNDVWYSSDGITWKIASANTPFAPRVEFATIVYDNKIWIIGGNANDGTPYNDVWYSPDGITWTLATPHAGFSPRMEPSAGVYDEKIWVTGGSDWKRLYNDVWTSQDGVTWTLVSPYAPFPARSYQYMETTDEKLWVIGGFDGKNSLNDVWYTTDGISWTQTAGDKTYPPRYGFTTAVFKNKLWVIAGTSGNDVWSSQEFDTSSSINNSLGSSGTPKNQSAGILVTKKISPVSLKQGTDARISITVFNKGPAPVHDIEILDTTLPEFPVVNGITQFSVPSIEPNGTRILTYTVHATKPGSFRLNKTAVMYADQDGNYHMTYSNYEKVEVLPSLIAETSQETPDDFIRNLISWINGLDPFAQPKAVGP